MARLRHPIAALLAALMLLAGAALQPAMAQRSRMSFIRDAEIEATLRDFATPIWRAAGIDPKAVRLVLVKDPSLNAFVAGGQNMFFNTGLLMDTDSPSQLIGVMAHESGHITGGHLIRGTEALKNASAEAIVGTLLAVAAGVVSGEAGAGMGGATAAQEMARRNFLQFSRAQENAADQAGLTFLDRAGMSARGMLEFMETLQDQELLSVDRQVEFVRTHPLTASRVDAVRSHVERSRFTDAPLPKGWEEQHERMRKKLQAFLYPDGAVSRYRRDTSFAGRYGYAIALWQTKKAEDALERFDELIAERPNDPWLWDSKGQLLLEYGRAKESAVAYGRAVALAGDQPLIRAAYGHALMESGAPLQQAIDQLEMATRQDNDSPKDWNLLARAYGQSGNLGMAAYAQSEEALARNKPKDALQFAKRAQDQLPRGSRGWLRADDVRGAAEALQKAQEDRE